MKTLPDSPHLDHLRQQAKDLLAGLRDIDPRTSLAAAQAFLAEQYGFGTWAELKAEVNRRGPAETAEPALAREIAARYGLGEVLAEMRSVARPDEMGRLWSLETSRGRWAVRNLDTWIPIVDTGTDLALQQAAARAGVLLPAPVPARSGAVVEEIDGHSWRVTEWLHSGPPLAAPVSARHTYQVGRILATIHRFQMPVDRLCPWHSNRFYPASWTELAAKAVAAGAGWAGDLSAAVPKLAGLESIGDGSPPEPPVLCHNNLVPGRVRLAGERLVVFGREKAGGQPPDWEISEALTHWTTYGEAVNIAGARALLEGYRSVAGGLPPLHLGSFRGTATGLLNYVAGEIDRALTADDGPERRLAERSVRHLLAHLPSRNTLERVLEALAATS